MPTTNWNLALYAIAKDAAEEKAMAQIIADLSSGLTTNECKISVQLNTKNAMTRHWITRGGRTKDPPSTSVNTSSAQEVTSFLNAATTKFPARSTALVLCGHGSGLDVLRDLFRRQLRWIRTNIDLPSPPRPPHPSLPRPHPSLPRPPFARPPNTARFPHLPGGSPYRFGPNPRDGSFLSNVALREGIEKSSVKRVDLLALNACWMGMLEVAREMRDVASVQVSSQVKSVRWNYGAIAKALSAKPSQSAEQLAAVIVESVRVETAAGKRDDSVAAFRSGAALDGITNALDTYATAVLPLVDSDWDHVYDALLNEVERTDSTHEADLGSLVSVLGRNDPTASAAGANVRSMLKAARLTQSVGRIADLQGLSLFCPLVKNLDLAAAYQGLDFAGNRWATFLKKWQAKLPVI